MAQFKADIKFVGEKEKKTFEKNEEFEMTVERAKEIETNFKKKRPDIKSVMTRIDKEEAPTKEKKATKEKE